MAFEDRSGRSGRRGGLSLGVVLLATVALAWPAGAEANLGDLTQLGCLNIGGVPPCGDAHGISDASSVVLSPDGKHAYVAAGDSSTDGALLTFDRGADGKLTQRAGAAGCISQNAVDGEGGPCVDGFGMWGANWAAISPDGTSVYVASFISSAITVFDRAADGTLTQKAGTAGCISQNGSDNQGATCVAGRGLNSALRVTVSPDGTTVYVAAQFSNAVAIFDRAADGTLTQKAGAAGCVSQTGSDGCADGSGLVGADMVAVSPDGTSAYVASHELPGAIAVFDRAADGTLTQKAGTAACISDDGSDGCADGRALRGAYHVTVSPDGKSVYAITYFASGFGASVVIFDRAADGSLTQKAGLAGCISDGGTNGQCTDGHRLASQAAVTVSPDGASVYVASDGDSAITSFDRAADGSLTQKPGNAGCISEFGAAFQCAEGKGLVGISEVVVSSDGKYVYAASGNFSHAVAFFNREGPSADMSMSLKGTPNPLSVGSQLTYQLRMRNVGSGPATGVTGVLTLAPSQTFVSATSACSHAAGVVTCKIARAIAPGAGATPSVTVTVGQAGLIAATATVSNDLTDPVPANNSATERTRVLP
jgi:DNA-binding beta-propeller fold protein YncE